MATPIFETPEPVEKKKETKSVLTTAPKFEVYTPHGLFVNVSGAIKEGKSAEFAKETAEGNKRLELGLNIEKLDIPQLAANLHAALKQLG